jgi:PBSX family phage terminase large subunit
MKVVYHPYLFNPLFWHLERVLEDPKIRFVFVIGGSSAGKTHTIVQNLLLYQQKHHCNFMTYRKESTTIDDTVYSDFQSAAKALELTGDLEFIKRHIRAKNGEYKTTFKGLDDPEKTKGLSSYQFVYMNEVSAFEKEDFDELSRRLRGKPNQKIIADMNPIDPDHWVNRDIIQKVVDDVPMEKWIDLPLNVPGAPTKYSMLDHEHSYIRINEIGNTVLIKTTYRDNFWIVGHPAGSQYGFRDEHTIANFDYYKTYKNDYYYTVYANGEFGRMKTGSEFFDEFSRTTHVSDSVEPDQNSAIILAFDFNRKPYSTCLLIQKGRLPDGKAKITVLDEICLTPPNNSITDIKDRIEAMYPWIKSVFYTGDPSGRARGQRKGREEANSYEEQIEIDFNQYRHNYSNIFLRSAPPLAKRQFAMSKVLKGDTCVLEISHRCKNLIKDFDTLTIDRTGGYVKRVVRDKATGDSYEEGGHCADALIYYLAYEFNEEFFPK